jgi:hypothetical protein
LRHGDAESTVHTQADTSAALRAAAVNAALFALVPVAVLGVSDYTADVFRPVPRTVLASAAYAGRTLAFLFPVSLFVGWRTFVNARGYCAGTTSVWRGPFESAATAAAIALIVVVMSTGDGFWTRPASVVAAAIPAYILYTGFYVVASAFVGLLIGLLLAATAVFTLSAGPPRSTATMS